MRKYTINLTISPSTILMLVFTYFLHYYYYRYCIRWMMRFSSKKVLCHIIVGLNVTSFLPIISLPCRKLDANNNICGSVGAHSFIITFYVLFRPPTVLTSHWSRETTAISTIVDWYHTLPITPIGPFTKSKD